MLNLTNKTDPTGFFRHLQSMMRTLYASPDGVIHSRGRFEHSRKAGPGRRRLHTDSQRAGTKLARKANDNRASKYRGGIASRAYENIQKAGRV